MFSKSLLKTALLTSSFLFVSIAHANYGAVPKSSMDLADWAQQTNDANKLQTLSSAQRINYNQQAQAVPVSYNPYGAMARQTSQQSSYSRLSSMPRGTSALRSPSSYPVGAANFTCVRQAAFDHQVPLRFLLAINSIERGRYNQKVLNSNSSHDLGQFQINTIHLPAFSKFGATEYDIANRGCYNAQAAARLLSLALQEPLKRHLDIFTRAAGYHSWTPQYNSIYRGKLITYLKQWDNWMKVNNIAEEI